MSTNNRLISILLFAVFLVTSQTSVAQNRLSSPERYLGFNVGATGSMVGFTPTISQSYLLGGNAGMSFRYVGHKFAGFQAELNYSQRGWNEADGLYSRRLDYIELPFMTHFFIGNRFKVFLNVGPKISYLIAEKDVNNNTSSTATQHTNQIQNKFDYGFCLGPGFLFKIQKQIFMLDLRANYSISDVFSNAQRDFFSTSNNINVSANFGWQFKLD